MLDKSAVLEIIQNELSQSDYSSWNGTVLTDLELSLRYYLGLPNGTEIEGRSEVTSTDVADAIEWIMPQIMKSFTQNNEIVIFDPVHEGDEKQAELESEYVYEVLMKQNDGFIILHQFVKDALMQRNGMLKVYYAKRNETKVGDYTGITEAQLNMLLSAQGVELREQTEYVDELLTIQKQQGIQMQLQQMAQDPQHQAMMAAGGPEAEAMAEHHAQLEAEMQIPVFLYDVKVSVDRIRGKIYVDPVPPEEFRVNSQHNSICLDYARFTAHVTTKTASEIIQDYNLSLEEVGSLPEGEHNDYEKQYRFALQNESVFFQNVSDDESQKEYEVSECYMMIDILEDGIARYMKITVAGGDTPSHILDVEEIDSSPWISTTAFLMSHKFQGLSITDRLRQIQDQKTALWRNMFDNMYLQNNQRNVVVEGMVNMDDLLVSRPGGIIRAKRLDAITPLQTPQLGQDAYNMMEYLDRVRAGRTGVDPDGQASPDNIGDRVGSEGIDRLMNAKEELVGLIIRVIAETGIKPLCTKIRDLSMRHIDAVVDFRFRGQWYQVNPSEWPDRTNCTVRVGTGTGNHALQRQALGQVLELQKILADSGSILVAEQKAFDTIDDFCKFSGLNGAVRYFVDPSSPEGQAAKAAKDQQMAEEKAKNDEMLRIQAEAQAKLGEAEVIKASAAAEKVKLQSIIDTMKNQITISENRSDAQIDFLKQQLEEMKSLLEQANNDADRMLRKYEIDQRTAVELTRIEKDSQKDENENFQQNKEDAAA